MNDADFLAAVLSDGKPHSTNEILHASFKERGCGLTCHSRASDLRKRGLNIECRPAGHRDGRAVYEYQLSPRTPGAAVPLPAAPDQGLDGHLLVDSSKAGGSSQPCSRPSFAKQLEIWSAA